MKSVTRTKHYAKGGDNNGTADNKAGSRGRLRPAEILHTADEVSGNEQNGGQDCSDNDIGELFNDIHRNADCA
jgi:hypothetical protein